MYIRTVPRRRSDGGAGWGLRRVTGRLPFLLWEDLTWDGSVTAGRTLLWILLWPAELLACLWVACWWLAAAMSFRFYRRRGSGGGEA